jgi:hypothetical protein
MQLRKPPSCMQQALCLWSWLRLKSKQKDHRLNFNYKQKRLLYAAGGFPQLH